MIKQVDLAAQASANVHMDAHTYTNADSRQDWIGFPINKQMIPVLSCLILIFVRYHAPLYLTDSLPLYFFHPSLLFTIFCLLIFFTVHLFSERDQWEKKLLRHSNIIVHMKDTNNNQPFFFLFLLYLSQKCASIKEFCLFYILTILISNCHTTKSPNNQ